MPYIEELVDKVSKSKAALDVWEAYKLYTELSQQGWPRDTAWQFAFTGTCPYLDVRVRPLPEPDRPYFSLTSLHDALKDAHSNVVQLQTYIESQLKLVQAAMQKQRKGK